MRPVALLFVVLALISLSQGRSLMAVDHAHNKRKLTELPASITCTVSLLVSAGDINPAFACSPAYYNCLGVDIGGQGPLSYCQDGLVFDKTYYVATSTFPNGQGGACNYGTPACGGVPVVPSSPGNPGTSTAPVYTMASPAGHDVASCGALGFYAVPGDVTKYLWCTPNGPVVMQCAPGTTWGAGCP